MLSRGNDFASGIGPVKSLLYEEYGETIKNICERSDTHRCVGIRVREARNRPKRRGLRFAPVCRQGSEIIKKHECTHILGGTRKGKAS